MSENKVDPKEIEKVQKLLSDEEFVKKLISQETIEDAKKIFEEQGITTSIEEMKMLGRFIKKISEKGNEKLSEEDLEEIVGGGKLKNAAIRTGGVVTGAITGTVVGAISVGTIGGVAGTCLGLKASISDKRIKPGPIILAGALSGTTLTAIGGAIAGTITGAIKGYKIAGKWCT